MRSYKFHLLVLLSSCLWLWFVWPAPHPSLAQQPSSASPEDNLAAAFVAAAPADERQALVSAQPQLVNQGFRQRFRHALALRVLRLQLQGERQRSLATLEFARRLAAARNDKGWVAMTWMHSAITYDLYGQTAQVREAYGHLPPPAELASDPAAWAHVTLLRGFLRWRQEQRDVSVEDCQRALALLAPEQTLERALAHCVIGMFHIHDIETDQADEYLTRGLREFEALGDRLWTAIPLTYLGEHFHYRGDDQIKSFDYLRHSVAVSEEFGVKFLLHHNTKLLGDSYERFNNWEQAEVLHQKCLVECEALGAPRKISFPLRNLSSLNRHQGDYVKAAAYLDRALKLAEANQDHETASALWRDQSQIYLEHGKFALALECGQKSLHEAELTGIKEDIALARHFIGSAYSNLAEYQKARTMYEQSLQLIEPGMETTHITILIGIAWTSFQLKKFDEALSYNQQALKVMERVNRIGYQVATLAGLGDIHAARAEYDQALSFYERVYQVAAVHHPREAAHFLIRVGEMQRLLKQDEQARASFEQAIELSESWRARLANPDWRSAYSGWLRKGYESLIELLLEQHERRPDKAHVLKAFQLSEQSRARSLIDLLTEARADIRADVEAALLARERELQLALNAKSTQQITLAEKKKLKPELAAELTREIAALTAELERTSAQIRATSRRYAALTRPQPLSAAEVQNQLLDAGTLLLEYELGEQSSWLFAVTPEAINSYRLPPRAVIEAAAAGLRQRLATPPGKAWNANAYGRQARALSQMILGPVAAQLGQKRLVIVAAGALQYLSFAVLPEPLTAAQASGRGQPLIVNHEIVNLPSASTLAVLRRELAGRQPAPNAVAVLADPVFSADDPRVKKHAAPLLAASRARAAAPRGAAPDSPLERALRSFNHSPARAGLARLLLSRDEANEIAAAVPVGDGLKALDFQANRATATSSDLSRYRIVHFATHGLLNTEHPELSGLVFSLVDEQGQPQDGFLRLHDIYNLKLNAELVVLSACQTGLGKEVKGEGLVGLTRGFMYAGAARVTASLWKVDDYATSVLMKRFYRGLLQEKLRPAAALRQAQLEMWRQRQWQAPFYWGAFVLQGEWK